jgi:peroxiredoxin
VVVAISLYLVRGASQSAAAGGMAPAFSGTTQAGKTVSLDQFEGKPLLLVYMTDT